MNIPRAWGKLYQRGMLEHRGWNCPFCEASLTCPLEKVMGGASWYEYVRGFSPEVPGGSIRDGAYREDDQVIGIFIVECQDCFETCYMHVMRKDVAAAMKKCPFWPKGSEA